MVGITELNNLMQSLARFVLLNVVLLFCCSAAGAESCCLVDVCVGWLASFARLIRSRFFLLVCVCVCLCSQLSSVQSDTVT